MSQGVLITAGAGLLHTLRVMGNEAVYEVRPRKTEDLAAGTRSWSTPYEVFAGYPKNKVAAAGTTSSYCCVETPLRIS